MIRTAIAIVTLSVFACCGCVTAPTYSPRAVPDNDGKTVTRLKLERSFAEREEARDLKSGWWGVAIVAGFVGLVALAMNSGKGGGTIHHDNGSPGTPGCTGFDPVFGTNCVGR